MKHRSLFGCSYGQPSMAQWRGLGAIPAESQTTLLANVEPLWGYLDTIGSRINDAARAGVDAAVIGAMRDQRDALRASLQRLEDRISVLETEDEVAVWQDGYMQLRAEAAELDRQIVAVTQGRHESRLWSVGSVTAGVVLGTVGLVFLVRWYGKRRSRR